jgi:hypothetical protein
MSSKDERDAPDQFLMGAMDPQYCVLLNLAIHLETEGMSNGSSLENDWVFPLGSHRFSLLVGMQKIRHTVSCMMKFGQLVSSTSLASLN